ncbi:MAG: 4-(cytidine 5'-diphospho)-2-C-methyl-D-erythritol kinase [Micropepsaceae bacterium]
MRRLAPAKINLFLHVGDKRPDGYHNLLSLAVFADLGDWLALAPASALSLNITGPFAAALAADDDNLVMKAARALTAWAGKPLGADLTLEKNLPIASGIGGGSSDAATALLMLAEHWALPIGIEKIRELALALGADVPVCLNRRPTLMSGIGEILKPAPELPPFALVLVNPGVSVPTAQIFKALRTRTGTAEPKPFKGSSIRDFALWLDQLSNDLAAPAIALAPAITRVEAAITATGDCLLARMSGSGATCFGLYATHEQAKAAASSLAKAHPEWWVRAAQTYAPA